MRERNVTLCSRCFSACRAAFSADFVFATLELQIEGRVVWGRSKSLSMQARPNGHGSGYNQSFTSPGSPPVGGARATATHQRIMELIRRLDSVNSRDCVVTIGSFDGLHLGHQVLIERLRSHAARLALPAMMVTFEPLPREFLQAANPPARLTNFRERWRLLSACGLDRLCVLGFGNRLRALSGLQFMQLLAAARARVVVVGHDFRFGRGGAT